MTQSYIKNSSASKHTTPSEPDTGRFRNAEDFYDYYYDDFFDYYDAENYW
jgi:hypothetical protein